MRGKSLEGGMRVESDETSVLAKAMMKTGHESSSSILPQSNIRSEDS